MGVFAAGGDCGCCSCILVEVKVEGVSGGCVGEDVVGVVELKRWLAVFAHGQELVWIGTFWSATVASPR